MTSSVQLTDREQAMLAGDMGEAAQIAMGMVAQLAEWMGAAELLEITSAHIDGCLYTGQAGLDFAERLVAAGGQVAVPTTLNVSSLDLLHPDLYRGPVADAEASRRQMDAYLAMGCEPTWTCAPYQLPVRPGLGDQVAWGESNAIVFANSVLGARTDRYGDFADIACALTGRAPAAGLHLAENRDAGVVVDVSQLPAETLADETGFALVGHWLGRTVGALVPAIVGVDTATEDQLKVLGAAAASSGAVAMFHVVGVTPEAPTLDVVMPIDRGAETLLVSDDALTAIRLELGSGGRGSLGAVSLGTPHYSRSQLSRLVALFAGRRAAVPIYVATGRHILQDVPEIAAELKSVGVTLVTDTCTYITPIIEDVSGFVLTDSAKWAYYAPGNIGVEVAFGSTAECVEAAVSGRFRL